MNSYQSLVERKLIPKEISGSETAYACPYCENDAGHHLYINYDKNKWHCVKCGKGGKSISSLLHRLNISTDIDYDMLYNGYEKSIDDILSMGDFSPKQSQVVQEYSTDLLVLNEYYLRHTQPLSPRALEYLLSRGFSYDTIYNYGLSEGINNYDVSIMINGKEYKGRDYSGRIMIPSLRRDGLISFYTSRDYTGTKRNKYSHAPKELAVASEDVWGLDIVDSNSVVICEGTFTALAINNALGKKIACATYGKSISSRSTSPNVSTQGEKLLSRGFNTYIMLYDRDAGEESYDNARYLYERGAHVKVARYPEDLYPDNRKLDANDVTPQENIDVIMNAVDYTELNRLNFSLSNVSY